MRNTIALSQADHLYRQDKIIRVVYLWFPTSRICPDYCLQARIIVCPCMREQSFKRDV